MEPKQIPNVPVPRRITDAQAIIDWRNNNPNAVPKNYPARWQDAPWQDDPSRGIDNGYSRLYPESDQGSWLIVHTAWDGECHLWTTNSLGYVGPINETEWNPVGWNQEPRWTPDGKIVYRYSNAIWKYAAGTKRSEKILDLPNAIYTGGEGSVSDDGRYYPVMTGTYYQSNYMNVQVGIVDLQNRTKSMIDHTPKPNAIDVSPCGKWFMVLNHQPNGMKVYPIKDSGAIDTLKFQVVNPGFSVGHSGWAVTESGATCIVYQNNNTDQMQYYVPISDARMEQVAHMKDDLKMWDADGNVMGWHCARGNASTKGWALISTYARENFNEAANTIYMLRLDGSAERKVVCRTGNLYRGYHSESFAGLSRDGKRIYWGANDNASRNVELYTTTLPDGWQSDEPVMPPSVHHYIGTYDVFYHESPSSIKLRPHECGKVIYDEFPA